MGREPHKKDVEGKRTRALNAFLPPEPATEVDKTGSAATRLPFAKRIKRHLIGKPHDFFAITAPGFERLCLSELASLGMNGRAVAGGVEFSGRLHECYLANLSLRTASRILMRIHSFRAIAFRSLEKAASQFPWELYLSRGTAPKLHVTTRHCRLYHTAAIAERMVAMIRVRLEQAGPTAAPAPSTFEPQVFVRGTDDRFSVSIDSSGDNLYLRGIKTHPGRAPLRETMAAAALMRAGFSSAQVLLDPMCGAGTFSLEAALIVKNIPPGWFRDFSFTDWPGFRPQRWSHIRRKAAERIQSLGCPRILASDIDPEACRRLDECVRRCSLSDAVSVACRDFFKLDPREVTDRPGLVTLNPPYGRRLGKASESRELFGSIIARIRSHYAGWKFILVVPADRNPTDIGLPVQTYPFFHGGLKVEVMVGNVSPA
jgi:putative N6-adenine-specific DNA methylase